jgi:hypothetical protein
MARSVTDHSIMSETVEHRVIVYPDTFGMEWTDPETGKKYSLTQLRHLQGDSLMLWIGSMAYRVSAPERFGPVATNRRQWIDRCRAWIGSNHAQSPVTVGVTS